MNHNQVKKIFVSCPMRDRAPEAIKKTMNAMFIEALDHFKLKENEAEMIETYFDKITADHKKDKIWYLGEAIKKMADADYFIGPGKQHNYTGCNVERAVAKEYGIKIYEIYDARSFMPDIANKIIKGIS